MQIKTEINYNHLGLPRRTEAQIAAEGKVAKTVKEAVHFVEAPFKTKVVVYETAEDLLE